MKQVVGDMWNDFPTADVLAITTNSTVNNKGAAVMGAGTALQAAERYPMLPLVLGTLISSKGSQCYFIPSFQLVMFPVKNAVWENAKIPIIVSSCLQLVALANTHKWRQVILPQPGCGAGGLRWDQVQPVIEPLLDDRFTLVSYGN